MTNKRVFLRRVRSMQTIFRLLTIFYFLVFNTSLVGAKNSYTDSVQKIEGQAKIIDGDTLKINNIKIRLVGVDTPELQQVCQINGHMEQCGQIIAFRLYQVTFKKKVTCYSVAKDFYGRVLAECFVDNININEWLLREGLAVYYYSKGFIHYRKLQEEAKKEKLGIWSGEFIEPKEYRKSRRSKR